MPFIELDSFVFNLSIGRHTQTLGYSGVKNVFNYSSNILNDMYFDFDCSHVWFPKKVAK